jgi:hypothetical protein
VISPDEVAEHFVISPTRSPADAPPEAGSKGTPAAEHPDRFATVGGELRTSPTGEAASLPMAA